MLKAGDVAVSAPVPDTLICWVPSPTLSVKVTMPVRRPAAVGANCTPSTQL